MRISRVVRMALLASATTTTLSLLSRSEANTLALDSQNDVATFDTRIDSFHEGRALSGTLSDKSSEDVKKPAKKKKKDKKTPKSSSSKKKDETKKAAKEPKAAKTPKKKKKTTSSSDKDDSASKAAKKKIKADEAEEAAEERADLTKDEPKKTEASSEASSKTKKEDKDKDDPDSTAVSEKKIKGDPKEGVIDGSSDGDAEIDKIDLTNSEKWHSVYEDPPMIVIKASLYAFIAYNDTEVCDTFNMTMNAVEEKEEENGHCSYHVVAYINCTKNNEDMTQGRFILNFIPEGKRLLLTECGHREEGEIVNWLRIQDEVPECMTPKQRKQFLSQPMKHIHISNGTTEGLEAVQTDFFSRLEEFDTEEVAILGSATVALIVAIVVLVLFVIRKRKAQKDLERTIAGAKAEHAVEDDDLQTEVDEKATKERKGLMDSVKATGGGDPDMEEGSFVNSPAVRV